MAYIIDLKNFADDRGVLNVIQDQIPFDIKRIYYIHSVPQPDIRRGGHRHHKATQALICLGGHCTVFNHDGDTEAFFELDSPNKVLIVEPKDWHVMYNFSPQATLLVLASTPYDVNDYIDTPYPNTQFLIGD